MIRDVLYTGCWCLTQYSSRLHSLLSAVSKVADGRCGDVEVTFVEFCRCYPHCRVTTLHRPETDTARKCRRRYTDVCQTGTLPRHQSMYQRRHFLAVLVSGLCNVVTRQGGKQRQNSADASAIWNTIPDHLRSPSISKGQFRCGCGLMNPPLQASL